ncbi:MAG: hypothetical protein LC750_01850, partial [Actinobacteria bacterium]|nr:hypothetical protein [Actinomycetota bacterium]
MRRIIPSDGDRPRTLGGAHMGNYRRLLGLAFVVCLFVPQTGHAARTKLRYSAAHADKRCQEGPGSACPTQAVAARTGAFTLDTSIVSPAGGLLPGSGRTDGYTSVDGTYVLKRAVKTLPITATIHIDSASVTHSGLVYAQNPQDIPRAGADVTAALFIISFRCSRGSCEPQAIAAEFRPLADLGWGTQSMSRNTITMKTVLGGNSFNSHTFGPGGLRPGTIFIHVELFASAAMGATNRNALESQVWG